jgi:hypothetical protein
MDIKLEHAVWTSSTDMQQGICACTWRCSMAMQHGNAALACRMDTHDRPKARTRNMSMLHLKFEHAENVDFIKLFKLQC